MDRTVKLTAAQKAQLCINIAEHLPAIRKTLGITQEDFGELCGFSRIRVSHIENGRELMSWSQLTSVMLICFLNPPAKEYLISNELLPTRFMQFLQMKSEDETIDFGTI